MLYLDTSALVKTVVPERESAMLLGFLRSQPAAVLFTSQLAITELTRAVMVSSKRLGREAVAQHLDLVRDRLAGLQLVAITVELLEAAGRLDPLLLRTLDAIHLATALQFRGEVTAIVTYDHRLAAAARAAGVGVESPGLDRLGD